MWDLKFYGGIERRQLCFGLSAGYDFLKHIRVF